MTAVGYRDDKSDPLSRSEPKAELPMGDFGMPASGEPPTLRPRKPPIAPARAKRPRPMAQPRARATKG